MRTHLACLSVVTFAVLGCGGSQERPLTRESPTATPVTEPAPRTDTPTGGAAVAAGPCEVLWRSRVPMEASVNASIAATGERAMLVQGGTSIELSLTGPVPPPTVRDDSVRGAVAYRGTVGRVLLTSGLARLDLVGAPSGPAPFPAPWDDEHVAAAGAQSFSVIALRTSAAELRAHVTDLEGRRSQLTVATGVANVAASAGPAGVVVAWRVADQVRARTIAGQPPALGPELVFPAINPGGRGGGPSVVWAGARVVISYSTLIVHTGGRASEGYFAVGTPGDAGPSEAHRVRGDGRYVSAPILASDGRRPVIAWTESDPPPAGGRNDIYLTTLDDTLGALTPEPLRVTTGETAASDLAMAVSGDHVWVSWLEQRDGARTRMASALRCNLALGAASP